MGARPYDPTTGRFLSVDPIDGGSLNNYDYADQDPLNQYDLAGTSPRCDSLWNKILDRAFRNKREEGGGGTHGALPRFVELLEHGDLEPGHVQAFQQAKQSVKNAVKDFFDNGCGPPDGGLGQSILRAALWTTTLPTPTPAQVAKFESFQSQGWSVNINVPGSTGFWAGVAAAGALVARYAAAGAETAG